MRDEREEVRHPFPVTACLAVCAVALVATGCQGRRLFTPVASTAMDTSPPQMHGPSTLNPSMRGHVRQDSSGQVRVTSEAAVPETSIPPVEQRLATVKHPKPPVQQSVALERNEPGAQDNSVKPIGTTQVDQPARNTIQPTTYVSDAEPFKMPAGYGGVDVSGLMKALQDAPPEVQKAAIGRLIAMSRKRAQPSPQPLAIEEALKASFDSLPELPEEVIDRGINPTRLASGEFNSLNTASNQSEPAQQTNDVVANEPASIELAMPAIPASTKQVPAKQVSTEPATDSAFQPIAATEISFSDQASKVQTVSAEQNNLPTTASQTAMQYPAQIPPAPEVLPTQALSSALPTGAQKLSDTELFDALVSRLQTPHEDETEAELHRRIVMARHLLVLSGDPDRAVEKIEGLSNEEEEFLRHQLLGLWTIIDPNGHPVPSRRLSSALPEMRKATGFLAAASDTARSSRHGILYGN